MPQPAAGITPEATWRRASLGGEGHVKKVAQRVFAPLAVDHSQPRVFKHFGDTSGRAPGGYARGLRKKGRATLQGGHPDA